MKENPNNKSTHSNKKAAALKYDGVSSPKLVAKGSGLLAQQIVDLAEENDIHVHYDPLLLDVLSRLELEEEIPETLYLSVAKIIAFAYYLQGKHPDSYKTKQHARDKNIKQLALTSEQVQAIELSKNNKNSTSNDDLKS